MLAALGGAWLALVIHPQPLFAYSATRANVVLHARSPLPVQAGPMLEEVVRRVSRSPLYDGGREHHVFLCDTPALFALFAPLGPNVGGVAQWHLAGHAFIRPSNVARGTVIGPSGAEKTGERTLTYYIAHEITHAMTASSLGRWRYGRLSAFQQEGYADYVAFDHRVDLPRGRAALERGDRDMVPKLSGLYKRHELLVAYLLERQRLTVQQLFERPMDRRAVETTLLTDGDLAPPGL